MIENLAATENQFDSIDLSDNSIVKLEGFPRLLRLRNLYLNNNRIARIGSNLDTQIPNLEALILTNNKIERLDVSIRMQGGLCARGYPTNPPLPSCWPQDIEMLSGLKKLSVLSLLDNPITKHKDYRMYTIARLKALKVLDFKKVKQSEREKASRRSGRRMSRCGSHCPGSPSYRRRSCSGGTSPSRRRWPGSPSPLLPRPRAPPLPLPAARPRRHLPSR